MDVLELPNGVCQKPDRRGVPHGPRLNVSGEPVCLKCKSDAERAANPTHLVVTAKDPGRDAMDGQGRIKPAASNDNTPTVALVSKDGSQSAPVNPLPVAEAVMIAGTVPLQAIRDAIFRLPMPKSLKQYKRFQKIQQLIDQALEDENGAD